MMISLRIPEALEKKIQEAVKSGLYKNRSDFILAAIRNELQRVNKNDS